MNNITIIGYLAKNVELKFTKDERPVANGAVAVKRRMQDKTDFINITAWGNTAEKYFAQYGTKGRLVAIEGELNIDTWKKDGKWNSRTYITARNIKFLNKSNKTNESVEDGFQEVDDQDIPF